MHSSIDVCGVTTISGEDMISRTAVSCWVAKTDDGMRVADVWETREQFDRFAKNQIGPHLKEVGIEKESTVRFYDVHNYLTAR
jgi:hypothetical protein